MARESLFKELIGLLKENKKWWLIPVLLILGMLSGLVILAQTAPAIAPFIYTLF